MTSKKRAETVVLLRLPFYKAVGKQTDVGSAQLYSNLNSLGTVLESCPTSQFNPTAYQTYTLCSLTLPTGKWLLIGRTLAGGDLIIDGDNRLICANGRNNYTTGELTLNAFAIFTGGSANLKLVSNGYGTVHNDRNYCSLRAIRIN